MSRLRHFTRCLSLAARWLARLAVAERKLFGNFWSPKQAPPVHSATAIVPRWFRKEFQVGQHKLPNAQTQQLALGDLLVRGNWQSGIGDPATAGNPVWGAICVSQRQRSWARRQCSASVPAREATGDRRERTDRGPSLGDGSTTVPEWESAMASRDTRSGRRSAAVAVAHNSSDTHDT